MTSEQLHAAEQCALAASGERWTLEERAWGAEVASDGKCIAAVLYESSSPRLADARFIASARELVPALVSEVHRLRAALDVAATHTGHTEGEVTP